MTTSGPKQEIDITKYQSSAQRFLNKHGGFGKYFYCNLMNVSNPEEYIRLLENLGASYYDGVTWSMASCENGIELERCLGADIWRLRTPIVYFVDSAAALKNDAAWWERRHGVADIVVDLNGSILSADEVQSLTL
jgi:hypothetical protein